MKRNAILKTLGIAVVLTLFTVNGQAQPPMYAVIDLGELTSNNGSFGFGVNNNGQAVG